MDSNTFINQGISEVAVKGFKKCCTFSAVKCFGMAMKRMGMLGVTEDRDSDTD